MDTQWTQPAQNVNYYVPADNSDAAMIYELSTQSTETTQRGLRLEDFIGCDEIASHWNLPHTGPFTQPQYGGDSSSCHGPWIAYPTVDNIHPVGNIPNNHVWGSAGTSHENCFRTENMPQDHAPHESTSPLCAIVDSQPSQIRLSPFEPLSSYTSSSTPLLPEAILPQQAADTRTSPGLMMPSQDGNNQLDSKLLHDDTESFYALATYDDDGTARVFQLVGPKDRVPVVNCLPNGVRNVSWRKF